MPNNIEKLNDNIHLSTYGVSRTINDTLNTDDDALFRFTDNSVTTKSGSRQANISDAIVRDGRKKSYMDDEIKSIMEAAGKSNINNLPYTERILLNKELNFIMTHMPQIADTLDSIADMVISPDLYDTRGTINVSVPKSARDAKDITETDITAILESANFRQLVLEGIAGSAKLGYCYISIVPYTDIAKRMLSRVSKSNMGTVGKSQIKLFGESILKDKKKVLKLDSESLIAEASLSIAESFNKEYLDLISESANSGNNKDDKYDTMITRIVNNIFDKSPYTLEDRAGIAKYTKLLAENMTIENTDILYAEADISADNEKAFNAALKNLRLKNRASTKENIKKLSGCAIEVLDNEKTCPIILNKELVGVLKVDRFEDRFTAKPVYDNFNNVTGSQSYRDKGDYADNPLVRRQIVDDLTKKIKEHLDENFVIDNKRIIGAIEHILEENDSFTTDCSVRFIPRKYLVPFNSRDVVNGLGKTKLLKARIPAIFWILLNNNKMMTKLFYEKDKIVIKYRTTMQQDLTNERDEAFDIFRNLFPLPSDLLNFSRTYSSMSSIGRLLIPMNRKGEDLFTVDRIEGQKPQPEDDEDMRKYESTIENILGFPLASLNKENNSFEYATAIIAQDGRLTTKIMKMQDHYQEPASELASKILRNYFMDDSITAEAKFQRPKTLNTTINNEQSSKVNEHVDNIMNISFGETITNPLKIAYMRRKIVTELTGKNSLFDFDKIEEFERDWKADKNVELDKNKDNVEE